MCVQVSQAFHKRASAVVPVLKPIPRVFMVAGAVAGGIGDVYHLVGSIFSPGHLLKF